MAAEEKKFADAKIAGDGLYWEGIETEALRRR